MKRLGVNIDHVATVRNARGEIHPDPYKAALFVKKKGADSITIHLREDRRHIRDLDAKKICSIKKFNATLVGFATIIDRSSKKTLKIKKKIISHLKIEVPTYKSNKIPKELDSIPISTPGSRFIK